MVTEDSPLAKVKIIHPESEKESEFQMRESDREISFDDLLERFSKEFWVLRSTHPRDLTLLHISQDTGQGNKPTHHCLSLQSKIR